MSETLIANANDVELIVSGNTLGGDDRSVARMIVNDFSFSREEDNSTGSGVGNRKPVGRTNGNITFAYSFTIQGVDADLFADMTTQDGKSIPFDATARVPPEQGGMELSLIDAKNNSEEFSGTDNEMTEYAVEGDALDYEREILTE